MLKVVEDQQHFLVAQKVDQLHFGILASTKGQTAHFGNRCHQQIRRVEARQCNKIDAVKKCAKLEQTLTGLERQPRFTNAAYAQQREQATIRLEQPLLDCGQLV